MKKSIFIIQQMLVIPWILFLLISIPINTPVITIVYFVSSLIGIALLLEYIQIRIGSDVQWEDKWFDIKYNIYHFYPIEKIHDFYYNITQGVSNLFKWRKVIWNDRNWDDNYIFRILQFKFENMEKFFNSDKAYSARAKKDAKRIMTAKNLCKRIVENNYLSNALIDYYKKYGNDFKWEFEPCKDKSNFSTLIDKRAEEEQKSFSKAGDHSDLMEKQDIDYLFKFLNKHIQSWWD